MNKNKSFLMKLGNKLNIEHWQIIAILLVVYDAIAVNASYFIALLVRYNLHFNDIPTDFLENVYVFSPIYTFCCIIVFYLCRMYKSIWQFASFMELLYCLLANVITAVIQIVGMRIVIMVLRCTYSRMPMSYYCMGILLQFILVVALRFSYRFVLLMRQSRSIKDEHRIMIIGAGAAGLSLMRDIKKCSGGRERVCCIIDDNRNKWNRLIDGVKVVGGREEIFSSVDKYGIESIYLAIPSATSSVKRDILNICNETGCKVKLVPGLYQLANGEVTLAKMKEVSIEDLLGRDTIKTDMNEVFSFISQKTILVTGGGGSIGSELCRQIAAHQPKRLIIFDVYENNAYDIQNELKEKYPNLELITLIGSVRDSRRINGVFETYRPDITFHAAAHKHVPLMEGSPCEAIKNNAIGTYKTAYAAMTHGCKRFVLISTDKAVNPTNIMGASKRLCEMIIQSFARKIAEGKAEELPTLFTHYEDEFGDVHHPHSLPEKPVTEFVAVRFGNVLGSNGSVIPLFKKQIAAGGPVTVTHPDIIRYFMTIPEAVSLVLTAGTYASGGEIFVLDMGSAVKIDTLARNLIRLSGFKPDVDIKIEYTGLRPGEKLFEEKLMEEEGLRTTKNKLIHIGSPIPFDIDAFLHQLEQLMRSAYNNDSDNIRRLTSEIVTTYKYK